VRGGNIHRFVAVNETVRNRMLSMVFIMQGLTGNQIVSSKTTTKRTFSQNEPKRDNTLFFITQNRPFSKKKTPQNPQNSPTSAKVLITFSRIEIEPRLIPLYSEQKKHHKPHQRS
jgi:Tfp pilus assembly protein FimT